METDTRPVIFLHIPKTAGLTLHGILTDQYPRRKQKIIYQVALTEAYKKLPDAKKRKIGVIKGHFLYGLHEHMPLQPVYLTLLRDPISRTVSGYHFIKTKKDHPFYREIHENKYSLLEFLSQRKIANFDNMQVRFLCGDNSMQFGSVNESHFELAKQNLLSHHMLFGITEMFDESVLYFKKELGWSNPYYANVNESKIPARAHTLDAATMDAVIQCNRFDLQLYEFAKGCFLEKIRSLGEGFDAELAAFRQENAAMRGRLQRRNRFRELLARLIPG